MAAGVAQLGQGVVLGEEGDDRLAFAVSAPEGRRQLADTLLDREAVFPEQLRQPGGGPALLEGNLRVPEEPPAQLGQRRVAGVVAATTSALSLAMSKLPPPERARRFTKRTAFIIFISVPHPAPHFSRPAVRMSTGNIITLWRKDFLG
jgi:hypothetical protein